MSTQLVWFKRDLRVADHAPLARAMAAGPVLAVYVIEPGYWAEPDTAQRHWAFIAESLIELDRALRRCTETALQTLVDEDTAHSLAGELHMDLALNAQGIAWRAQQLAARQ